MSSKKTITLMLNDNIENLGIVGDVVSVRPGYARNYLLPMGLAMAPTEGNRKRIEERRAEVQRQLAEERTRAEEAFAKLEGFEITLMRTANEEGHLYGSVSQHDIAVALQEEGFELIHERHVRIGTSIKKLDSYDIPIQMDDLKTEIKLWVVSDKPAEELMAEEEAKAAGETGEAAEAPAEEAAEAPAEEASEEAAAE
ncbi:MAG: 50S ribosomal protein L9 [Planctomycetota bacterium]|jgi:large subunit ribosomal protein L9